MGNGRGKGKAPKAGQVRAKTRAAIGRLRNRVGGFDTLVARGRGNNKAAARRAAKPKVAKR